MRAVLVVFLVLLVASSFAGDLEALKAAANHYAAAMRFVLETQESSECFETIEQASAYAAAKTAYYQAARKAMPALLQIAKGEDTDSRYGKELTEIFRSFGENRDQEATGILTNALSQCPASAQRDQALKAIKDAQEMATRFVKDFGGLEGV
jgi:hypothetical protein